MTAADTETADRPHFLSDPPSSVDGQALLDSDLLDPGFVMNLTRLWGFEPSMLTTLKDLMNRASELAGLGMREKGILVTATASTLGDSYCSFAWGGRLATHADPETAAGVLRGDDTNLTPAERTMAQWARSVVSDPSSTRLDDVESLRAAGYTDEQIFGITVYVALRLAFSTINGALGASPDAALRELVPEVVQASVTWGRQMPRTS
ncbi:MAG: hypothetical protein AB7L17_18690 [Ilumatobacteraceae bacterium]